MSYISTLPEVLQGLPVTNIVNDVVNHSFAPFSVGLVTSRTGSGKTMIIPAALAAAHSRCIYVIEPRRILAIEAARNLSKIYGTAVGTTFGYGVGSRGGEESKYTKDTRVVFVTTGYAIASGLLNTASDFVIDEYHETTLDLSIAKAILERRRRNGVDVRIVAMSATGDEEAEVRYWSSTCDGIAPKVFHTDGISYPCEFLHRPAHSISDSVLELVGRGSNGILVFLPGIEEIQREHRELSRDSLQETIADISGGKKLVISCIHGQMDADLRDAALCPASSPDEIRVLIGTNVIESGINIEWADGGISDGSGRSVVSQTNGSTIMTTVDLCRSRIDQQKGRVNRFGPGQFILASPLDYTKRELNEQPEILKTSLERIVINCAKMGIDPRDLRFDYQPNSDRIAKAEDKLIAMQILHKDGSLTAMGARIADLPFSLETGVMLEYARSRGRGYLGLAVPLIAAYEVEGLAFKRKHNMYSTSNFMVDGALALIRIDKELRNSRYTQRSAKEIKENARLNNVNLRKFDDALQVVRAISRFYDIGDGRHAEIVAEPDYGRNLEYKGVIDTALSEFVGRQDHVRMFGEPDALVYMSSELMLIARSTRMMRNLGMSFHSRRLEFKAKPLYDNTPPVQCSDTYLGQEPEDHPIVAGNICTLPSKRGGDFTLATDLVYISRDDIFRVARYWDLPESIRSFAEENKQRSATSGHDSGHLPETELTLGSILQAALARRTSVAKEELASVVVDEKPVVSTPPQQQRAKEQAPAVTKPDLSLLAERFNVSSRR